MCLYLVRKESQKELDRLFIKDKGDCAVYKRLFLVVSSFFISETWLNKLCTLFLLYGFQ